MGENVSLTAMANTGYAFINWTENGREVSVDSSYSFTANANRILVANYSSTTGISDITETNVLSVYPNPNTGEFTLHFDNNYTGQLNLRIYSATGVVVEQLEMSKLTRKLSYSVDLGNIAFGTYYIDIITTNDIITRAIIINK